MDWPRVAAPLPGSRAFNLRSDPAVSACGLICRLPSAKPPASIWATPFTTRIFMISTCHLQHLPIHVLRLRDAEQIEHGRGDVQQPRVLRFDLPIAKQHAGHDGGIDAMVAAPGFFVIVKHLAAR